MIRVFTIFCKLNLINISALELFEFAMDSFDISNCTCPYCGARNTCTNHCNYKRYLISYEYGYVISSRIKVSRVICNSCETTHAILPEILIPYGSYSLFFVLTVLRDYFCTPRNGTVTEICDKYDVSVSTLYRWIHLFYKHKGLWLGILEDLIQSSSSFLKLFHETRELSNRLSNFFSSFGFSFLQGSPQTTRLRSP